MGKGIKTRDVVEKLNKTGSVSETGNRAKNLALKTKNKIAEETDNDNFTAEEYASDKFTEKIRTGTTTAINKTETSVNKSIKTVEKKVKKKKAKIKEDKEKKIKEENKPNSEKDKEKVPESKKSDEKKDNKADKNSEPQKTKNDDIKQNDRPEIKTEEKREVKTEEKREVKSPRKKEIQHPKEKKDRDIKKRSSDKKAVKTTNNNKSIKKTEYSSSGTKKTIKTIDSKVKAFAKTVKNTKTTAKTTAEVAKQSKRAAKVAAKTTVKVIKAAAKAVVEGAKATVAAVKEIATAVIAGGPVVIIIVVVCLIGAIGGTCLGIFLSNDKTTGTEKTMTETISLLTTEHYAKITDLQNRFSHEAFEVEGKTNINWKDVLTIYSVKTTTSEVDSQEVVTMNDIKLDILRKTVHDMNKVTGAIIKKYVPETIVETDENGNSVSKVVFVEKNVLVVNVIQKSAAEMAEIYKFDDEQKKMVNELMSEDYDEMWNDIIGAAGDIIISNSTWQGTDIFKWPLPDNFYITSPFGYRKDPATGISKFHGGTDIAAPQGTPILAPADGIVELATYNAGGYGYYVKLRHNETYETLFGHCSVLLVTGGQSVKQGQIIAQVGSTGYSTGPHLHYEVRQNGTRVNAMMFYK